MRHLIGAAIELAVGEGLVTTDHSNGVGSASDLGLKHAMDTLVIGIGRCGGVPLHQQAMAFVSGQQG